MRVADVTGSRLCNCHQPSAFLLLFCPGRC